MRRTAAAVLAVIVPVAALAAADTPKKEPELRFPHRYAYYTTVLSCRPGAAFTQCYDEVKQCISGYRQGATLIGRILKDGTTIAHLNCGGTVCYNLDTGAAFVGGEHLPQLDLKEDMTEVEASTAGAQCAAKVP